MNSFVRGLQLFAFTTLLGLHAYAQLPVMLTKDFRTRSQICEHARANSPGKTLAIVALKNHICDFEAQACLNVTRTLSDPCNQFIQKNFALYHTRLYRGIPGHREHGYVETPGNDEISDEWGSAGPDLIVVDVRRCEIVGRTGAGIDGFRDPSALERFRAMRAQLLRIHGVPEALGFASAWQEPAPSELTCAGFDPGHSAERSVDQIWNELEAQSIGLGQI